MMRPCRATSGCARPCTGPPAQPDGVSFCMDDPDTRSSLAFPCPPPAFLDGPGRPGVSPRVRPQPPLLPRRSRPVHGLTRRRPGAVRPHTFRHRSGGLPVGVRERRGAAAGRPRDAGRRRRGRRGVAGGGACPPGARAGHGVRHRRLRHRPGRRPRGVRTGRGPLGGADGRRRPVAHPHRGPRGGSPPLSGRLARGVRVRGHRAGGRHRRCGGRGPRGAGVGGCHVRSGGPRLGGVDRAYARVLVVSRQPRPPGAARRPGAGEPLVPRGSGRSRPAAAGAALSGGGHGESRGDGSRRGTGRTAHPGAPPRGGGAGGPPGGRVDGSPVRVRHGGRLGRARPVRGGADPGPAHRPDGGGRSGHGRDAPPAQPPGRGVGAPPARHARQDRRGVARGARGARRHVRAAGGCRGGLAAGRAGAGGPRCGG